MWRLYYVVDVRNRMFRSIFASGINTVGCSLMASTKSKLKVDATANWQWPAVTIHIKAYKWRMAFYLTGYVCNLRAVT